MRRSTSAGLSHGFASLLAGGASHLLGYVVLASMLALSPLLSATEAPSSLNVPPELISPQDLCQGSGIVCTTGPIGARITALSAEQIAGERLWFNANKSHATSGIAKYTWSLTKPNGSFAELNSTRNRAIYFDCYTKFRRFRAVWTPNASPCQDLVEIRGPRPPQRPWRDLVKRLPG